MKRHIIKTALFVLAAIATFVVLVALKYQFSHHCCPPNLGLRGLRKGGGTEVLFIGSSVTRAAYDLKQFEQLTGRRGYVMSYNALDPKFSYPLLKYMLEQTDVHPETVVLEGNSAVLCVESHLRDENLFYHAPPALKSAYLDIIDADADRYGTPPLWFRIWQAVCADTAARRRNRARRKYDWRDKYALVVAGKNGDILTSPVTNRLLTPYYYRGAFTRGPAGHINADRWAAVAPGPMDVGPFQADQVEALQKIIALLQNHGIKVVFVLPPLPAGVLQAPAVQEANARLRGMVEAAGCRYIDGAGGFPTDDRRMYLDTRHLSRRGRRAFTKHIAPHFKAAPPAAP